MQTVSIYSAQGRPIKYQLHGDRGQRIVNNVPALMKPSWVKVKYFERLYTL